MQSERIQNLEQLRILGEQPFKVDTPGKAYPVCSYSDNIPVELTGRILTIRRMGKMCFATILFAKTPRAEKLSQIQVVFKTEFTTDGWREIVKFMDIGDIVHFKGVYQKTISGECSVFVKDFTILTKALTTIPFGQEKDGETFNQINDIETLMRHRHIAMLTDDSLRTRLIARSQIISRIRHMLEDMDFIEAQTPTLLQTPGGAEAKTFDTHYNAYDADVKLRISLEIQLKKLLCGGFDRVFEIGTVFRNEGISALHNPEFTLLEYYCAYDNFEQGVKRFKDVIYEASQLSDAPIHPNDWETLSMQEAILKYAQQDINTWDFSNPKIADEIEHCMSIFVEPYLQKPTIITNHPACMSPLARSQDGIYAERFEAYINGMEIANGFCEQNDPQIQSQIFEQQSQALGNAVDNDFVYALSCGMPPAMGVGIGLDRLTMILTQTNHIRQVSWFPYVKPEKE